MTKKYKIVFDVFGVLLSRGFNSAAKQLSVILNKTVEDIQLVYERWEIPFDLGSLSEQRFWELVQYDLGTNASWQELNDLVKESYYPIEGSIDLLKRYSKSTDCYLLSNTRREWFEYLDSIYHLTKYVKFSFLSYEMNKIKPSLDIFLDVIKRLDTEPGNIIFIDDSLENIRAANSLGIKSHQFKNSSSAEEYIQMFIGGSTDRKD